MGGILDRLMGSVDPEENPIWAPRTVFPLCIWVPNVNSGLGAPSFFDDRLAAAYRPWNHDPRPVAKDHD